MPKRTKLNHLRISTRCLIVQEQTTVPSMPDLTSPHPTPIQKERKSSRGELELMICVKVEVAEVAALTVL